MRKEIGFEPVSKAQVSDLVERLKAVLPEALLFLDDLKRIELRRDGDLVLSLECLRDDDRVVMATEDQMTDWRLFCGTVEDVHLDTLRTTVGDEGVRRNPSVSLAVGDRLDDGLFFSWLPTQERVGLPFHLHADFFPTNDRKRLLWDSDYRSTWNRACLDSAAATLAGSLSAVRDELGAVKLWRLLAAAREQRSAEERGVFWRALLPQVRSGPFVYTDSEEWVTPSEAVLLGSRFRNQADVIGRLGIKAVHVDLEPHWNALTDQKSGAGVLQLQLRHVLSAWRTIEAESTSSDLPPRRILKDETLRRQFWTTLEVLLEQAPQQDQEALIHLDVLLTDQGTSVAPSSGRAADSKTRRLFASLDVIQSFVDLPKDSYPRLAQLVPDWSVLDAVEVLERVYTRDSEPQEEVDLPCDDLLRWFNARREQVVEGGLVERLFSLPLFPTAGGLVPLERLALPSDFSDPLHLASLVDLTDIRDCLPLLEILGARPLDVTTYVQDHLVPAVSDPHAQDTLKRSAVRFLADHPSAVHRPGVLQSLRKVAIVPCEDDTFALAGECYLPSDELNLLAERPRLARLPAENYVGSLALYKALGVCERPCVQDLIHSVRVLVSSPPSEGSIGRLTQLFVAMGERFGSNEISDDSKRELRDLSWLPVEDHEAAWHKPDDVAAIFERRLFKSQALFLALAQPVQQRGTEFIRFLDIQTAATADQVVSHLLHCSEHEIPVPTEVYRRLNDWTKQGDRAIERLRGTRCIYFEDHGFWRPDRVFLNEHAFGRFRLRLSHDNLAFYAFMTEVGVSPEGPDHDSAIDMLQELADQPDFCSGPLSSDDAAVVRYSWRLLSKAFEQDRISREELLALEERCVVLDADGQLNRPNLLFFADRGGMADIFSHTLGPNIIPMDRETVPAMEAAGVRRLSVAAELELIEIGDRKPSDIVTSRLRERRHEIERVVQLSSRKLSGLLDSLSVECAQPLSVKYSVPMQGRSISSPVLEPRVLSLTAEGVILMDADDRPPWPELGRELAGYLKDDDAGQVASGLYQALAPSTREDASALLDSLGFLPAVDDEPQSDVAGVEAGALGMSHESSSADPSPAPTAAPPASQPAGQPTGPPVGPSTKPTPPSDPDRSQRTPPNKRPRAFKRSRYATYVAPPGAEAGSDAGGGQAGRSRVERAGIAVALEYERARGRAPVEMHKNHTGYDIESKDGDGKTVRYIEVKGTSGAWGSDGVGVTAPEFEAAHTHGERYWLYVVEYADTEGAALYRVRDPAGTVSNFFFDGGWRAVAAPQERQDSSSDSDDIENGSVENSD